MKEICIINYSSNAAAYGIGTYIKEYINCLLKIGHKVNLVELMAGDIQTEVCIKKEKGIRIISIPHLGREHISTYNKSVCHLLRLYLSDSPNLIFHFNYFKSDSLLSNLKLYFPLSGYILTIHYLYWGARLNGDIISYKNIILHKKNNSIKKKYQDLIDNYEQEKKFFQEVDQIVCLSEDTYNLIKDLYEINSDKLALIPNGLTPRKIHLSTDKKIDLRKMLCIRPDEKIILFVGRIHQLKGIYTLLLAFRKVIQIYANCRLIIIGGGDFPNAMEKASNSVTQITFTGRLNKEMLYNWYNISDIAVFPSYCEESSYVGIEMLMHGLPIVASNGHSVRNMFNDNNAIIAPIGDYNNTDNFASELAAAILSLLQSDELMEIKHLQALNSYKTKYHLRNMQKKYLKLFTNFPFRK